MGAACNFNYSSNFTLVAFFNQDVYTRYTNVLVENGGRQLQTFKIKPLVNAILLGVTYPLNE